MDRAVLDRLMQSGLQGAVVVNTVLNKPQNTDAALGFFRMRTAERISRYAGRTRQEYARVAAICPNPFWHERAGDALADGASGSPLDAVTRPPPEHVALSADTMLEAAPAIDESSSGRQAPWLRRWRRLR